MLLLIISLFLGCLGSQALSLQADGFSSVLSRREVWQWPLGTAVAVGYGKVLSRTWGPAKLIYPEAHEKRVENTIQRALVEAILPPKNSLRILEVGIGSDCRLIRRGLYKTAFAEIISEGMTSIEVVGVDLEAPKSTIVDKAREELVDAAEGSKTKQQEVFVDLSVIEGSITSELPFPDGWFDSVICCLTLCSVSDQELALREIKRLIRPGGGTFGYLEHVAVDQDEPYQFLEWQQETLDPLQQLLAENCHLHRYTDKLISEIFETELLDEPGEQEGAATAVQLQKERFLVNGMWPVSCQCRGVIQRKLTN